MIKPIDEIPQNLTQNRKSYREMIRQDILEAIDKGIPAFEFVGDYKYRYLAQYAREEANRVLYGIARERFNRMRGDEEIYISSTDIQWAKYLTISSLKGETPDKTRVFCKVDLSSMDDDLKALVQGKQERRERYMQERKKLTMLANDAEEKLEVVPE